MKDKDVESAAWELLRVLALNIESLESARDIGFDVVVHPEYENAVIAKARCLCDDAIGKQTPRVDRAWWKS